MLNSIQPVIVNGEMDLELPGSLFTTRLQIRSTQLQSSDDHWYRDGTLVIQVSRFYQISICNNLTRKTSLL